MVLLALILTTNSKALAMPIVRELLNNYHTPLVGIGGIGAAGVLSGGLLLADNVRQEDSNSRRGGKLVFRTRLGRIHRVPLEQVRLDLLNKKKLNPALKRYLKKLNGMDEAGIIKAGGGDRGNIGTIKEIGECICQFTNVIELHNSL
jgi:hypothetical protein